MHDRPIGLDVVTKALEQASDEGCAQELRECLQPALEKAGREYGSGSPAYVIISALIDAL